MADTSTNPDNKEVSFFHFNASLKNLQLDYTEPQL